MLENKSRSSSAPSVILQVKRGNGNKYQNCKTKSNGKFRKKKLSKSSSKELSTNLVNSVVKFDGSRDEEIVPNPNLLNIHRESVLYRKLRSLSILPLGEMGNSSLTNSRRPSMLQQSKEKLELHICRINILLVMMQIGLGSSMAGLGLYLHFSSAAMTLKECPYWAAFPLLFTGLLGLFFCSSDTTVYHKGLLATFLRNTCATCSIVSAILCAVASVFTGHHGNWLAYYSEHCNINSNNNHDNSQSRGDDSKLHYTIDQSTSIHNHPRTPCCKGIIPYQLSSTKDVYNISQLNALYSPILHNSRTQSMLSKEVCECGYFKQIIDANNSHVSKWNPLIVYDRFNCYYVFSALKDYLILQCALYAVAMVVSLWLSSVIWTTKKHLRDRSKDIVISRKTYYDKQRIEQIQMIDSIPTESNLNCPDFTNNNNMRFIKTPIINITDENEICSLHCDYGNNSNNTNHEFMNTNVGLIHQDSLHHV